MSFGEALAIGIAKGVGTGYQQHFENQRRERFELKRMDKSFDMFKKQSQYSFGLQEISKQNEVLGSWEEAAKLGVNDLAFKAASKVAETFSKQDRPKVIRDTMKNFNNMSKSELLVRAGYTKPDYSAYIDNPDYQDAIPKARIAGMSEMPDASAVFKYDPRAYAQEQEKKAEVVTDYMRKKQDEFKGINTMGVVSFGAGLSDEVKNYIWKNRPSGMSVEMKGSEAISYDQNLLTSLVNSGQVVKIGSEMKFVGELGQDDKQLLGIGPQPAPTEAPVEPQPLYTEPRTEAYLQGKEAEEKAKVLDSGVKQISKNLGTGKGTPLTTYTELEDSMAQIDAMDDDTLKYLFQVGFSTDTARDVAAKFGEEEAQKAKDLISKMSGTVNSIRHELFGSALTEGESKAFQKQFADVGLLNNKENLKTQLRNLMDKAELGVAEKMAGFTPEQRQEFLRRNPQYAGVMSRVEGATTETKQTVSDLSEEGTQDQGQGQFTREGVVQAVDQLISSGQYDESQRQALTDYMLQKAGIK